MCAYLVQHGTSRFLAAFLCQKGFWDQLPAIHKIFDELSSPEYRFRQTSIYIIHSLTITNIFHDINTLITVLSGVGASLARKAWLLRHVDMTKFLHVI